MSRKIEKILAELTSAEETAKISIEEVPYAIRAGIGLQIAAAREKIHSLREELVQGTFSGRVVACFATGDIEKIAEVSAVMKKERGVVVNASSLYEEIAALVEPSFGADRLFRTTQHHLMIQAINEIARRLELGDVSMPPYVEAYCPDHANLLAYIRARVSLRCGTDLLVRTVRDDITKAVIADGLADRRIPVLLTYSVPEDQIVLAALFGRSGEFLFEKDFIATKENLVQVFRNM